MINVKIPHRMPTIQDDAAWVTVAVRVRRAEKRRSKFIIQAGVAFSLSFGGGFLRSRKGGKEAEDVEVDD